MDTTFNILKSISKEIQYSVIITDIILTLYVLWLIITNTAYWLPGVLFGLTPYGTWLLLKANKVFHLCLTHKLMLIHGFLIYVCCIYQAYFGFGILLYPMRSIMFILGLLLFIKLMVQQVKKYKKGEC